jgi:hypothetical protein
MKPALFSCRQKVSAPALCSVRVARSPSSAAGGDLESRFGPLPVAVAPLADHPALLDDEEMRHRAVLGLDDAFAVGVETQLALLDQIGQVRVFHLVEGREALEKLRGAVNVLQYGGLARLGEGVGFVHGGGP